MRRLLVPLLFLLAHGVALARTDTAAGHAITGLTSDAAAGAARPTSSPAVETPSPTSPSAAASAGPALGNPVRDVATPGAAAPAAASPALPASIPAGTAQPAGDCACGPAGRGGGPR